MVRLLPALVAALSLLGSSCIVGTKLRDDAGAIEKKIATAMEIGSRRCAPVDLATAQSHLEFLHYELEEGDYRRATFHRERAAKSIERALEITDPDKCADTQVLIVEPADRDGDGITDDVDQCPDEPEDIDGFEDENGCPDPDNDGDTVLDIDDKCPMVAGDPANEGCPVEDRDGDGIPDAADQCPDIPEDLDGNEDTDGCPEEEVVDQDGDGILDPDDACPLEPGTVENRGCPLRDRDGDTVTDDIDQCPDVPGTPPTGCPTRVLVVKTDNKIEIKKQILFDTGKASIKRGTSFEILDQVASVMKSNPGIKVVIEGHTDSRGKADYNLKLSDDRAASVRDALVERGVVEERMESIGYGESKPIASNRTRKGRAANRRVEFNIVQNDSDGDSGAGTDDE